MANSFFRFSMWQLIVLVSVVSLLLALVVWHGAEERELQNHLRKSQIARSNLEKAVRDDDLALARMSLEAGANPNEWLRTCIENGQLAMVEQLLISGADVEQIFQHLPDSIVPHGPPLFLVISCRQPAATRLKMLRLLVKYGADPRREVGRNAMDLAVFHSEPDVADTLAELGVPYSPREMVAFNRLEALRGVVKEDPMVVRKRFRPLLAARPEQGPTLLGLALERGHREMAEFLIESGAPLDTVEGLGLTPLHLAARGGDPELIRLLVAHGLDVNAKDEHQDTPLTDSVWRAPPEVISALVEAGADIDAPGINRSTALHLAVRAAWHSRDEAEAFSERVEVVRVLLAAGADPSIPDRNGETALDWARAHSPSITTLLGGSKESHRQ